VSPERADARFPLEASGADSYIRLAMPSARMRRVNEVMREVIGGTIATDLQDPRIGFVTVTAVETSPDLRAARVFVSVLGDERQREETLAGLRSSHGVLQSAVAAQLRLKRTPTLTFHYDPSIERGDRVTRLLEDEEGR
jgi:ribosome-binding factor A